MDDETRELWRRIKRARVYLEHVLQCRANLAGILSGTQGMTTNEAEYPSPDTAEVYMCVFGHKPSQPTCSYRLKFGNPMVWAGVFHQWGIPPADIECEAENEER